MKICAIVAEYNPFHNGHKYQIDKTREILGEDTAIVAIMSGNYTQRGELAVCDKLERAKAAVESGVDLVLELPFPYSISSAEFFASAAIQIIDKLGVCDHIVFGTENCSSEEILEYTKIIEGEEFNKVFDEISALRENADCGYPRLSEMTLTKIGRPDLATKLLSSNNILATEYIKAIGKYNVSITPLTINRSGAGYNDSFISGERLQSASAIRALLDDGDLSALDYVPFSAKEAFLKAIESKKMPSSDKKMSGAVISNLRLNSPDSECDIHDATGGLYNRLSRLSLEATDIQSLTALAETKKYTRARIRRAIWNTFFGVTSSEVRSAPLFTQILAMNGVGRRVLKRIPKRTDFHIFTKPTSTASVDKQILLQKSRSDRADKVYGLSLEEPLDGSYFLKMTPFVKCDE